MLLEACAESVEGAGRDIAEAERRGPSAGSGGECFGAVSSQSGRRSRDCRIVEESLGLDASDNLFHGLDNGDNGRGSGVYRHSDNFLKDLHWGRSRGLASGGRSAGASSRLLLLLLLSGSCGGRTGGSDCDIRGQASLGIGLGIGAGVFVHVAAVAVGVKVMVMVMA